MRDSIEKSKRSITPIEEDRKLLDAVSALNGCYRADTPIDARGKRRLQQNLTRFQHEVLQRVTALAAQGRLGAGENAQAVHHDLDWQGEVVDDFCLELFKMVKAHHVDSARAIQICRHRASQNAIDRYRKETRSRQRRPKNAGTVQNQGPVATEDTELLSLTDSIAFSDWRSEEDLTTLTGELLDELPTRHQELFECLYGLGGHRHTEAEVAQILGVNRRTIVRLKQEGGQIMRDAA